MDDRKAWKERKRYWKKRPNLLEQCSITVLKLGKRVDAVREDILKRIPRTEIQAVTV